MPLSNLINADPDLPEGGAPERIGKYAVKAKIGEGATSEVFLAHDPFADRDVAIKRAHRPLDDDERDQMYRQRFFASEAALVGSCGSGTAS